MQGFVRNEFIVFRISNDIHCQTDKHFEFVRAYLPSENVSSYRLAENLNKRHVYIGVEAILGKRCRERKASDSVTDSVTDRGSL